MLDLEGEELSAEEVELLQHPLVGGIILFSRNFVSTGQLEQLVKKIHKLRSPQLLIAVDHEGGRVQRFRDGFTLLPAAAQYGILYDHDRNKGKALAALAGWLMAIELRVLGIDFSFAPVLDVNHGMSEVIGDRAFHKDVSVVTELAHAYMQGMSEAGMASTGKHFPGHGGVAADSHEEVPVDDREYNELYEKDIVPFRRMIKHDIAAIMPAHVIYSKVDPLPAGYSEFWLKNILRSQLGFQGVIFSDDLNMTGAGAIGDDYTLRAKMALNAGCDVALICNNRKGAIDILDNLEMPDDPVAHMRLARMHGRHEITRSELQHNRRWRDGVERISSYQDNPSLEFTF